jgi:DNA-binding protein HU-beta
VLVSPKPLADCICGLRFFDLKENHVNKTELIEAVAAKADVSKAAAARAVDAMLETVVSTVSKGDSVTLVGFGTFEARKRAARSGFNPKTGEKLKIAASTAPAFKAGKSFKDSVNKPKASRKK